MVCTDNFSLWPGNFSARATHRSLPDAGRHFLRGAFVHGACADRTEIRYGARASAGHDSCVRATVGARIFSLFYVAAFQTHTGQRHSKT